jgi:hypothetical protein
METLSDGDDSFRGAANTVPNRELLEGAHRVLKPRVGAGAATDGVDLPTNAFERIVAGGLLGVTDGRENGALGVNEGREGVNEGREETIERGALGVNEGLEDTAGGGLNEGLEGATEDDLPELNDPAELDGEP